MHPFDRFLAVVYTPLAGGDDSRWRLSLTSVGLALTLLLGLGLSVWDLVATAAPAGEGSPAAIPMVLAALTFGYLIQQDLTLHRRMRRNPRTNLYELI